jgi:hypothetical protein
VQPDSYRQIRLEVASKIFPRLLVGVSKEARSQCAMIAIGYADLLMQANQEYPIPDGSKNKLQPPML